MVTDNQWEVYKNIINNAHNYFNQADVIWKRWTFSKGSYGEGGIEAFTNVTIQALIGFNVFRTWPITRHENMGELDQQNMVMQLNRKYLLDNNWLNDDGYFQFNPARDRFVHHGIEYKAEGDTLVSQAKNDPLHIYVVLLRQDPENNS